MKQKRDTTSIWPTFSHNCCNHSPKIPFALKGYNSETKIEHVAASEAEEILCYGMTQTHWSILKYWRNWFKFVQH